MRQCADGGKDAGTQELAQQGGEGQVHAPSPLPLYREDIGPLPRPCDGQCGALLRLLYAAFALRRPFIFPCAQRLFISIDRRFRPAADIPPRRPLLAPVLVWRPAPLELMPSGGFNVGAFVGPFVVERAGVETLRRTDGLLTVQLAVGRASGRSSHLGVPAVPNRPRYCRPKASLLSDCRAVMSRKR